MMTWGGTRAGSCSGRLLLSKTGVLGGLLRATFSQGCRPRNEGWTFSVLLLENCDAVRRPGLGKAKVFLPFCL